MAWDSPEERHQKKIKKTAKGAASALGGGVALWFFSLLYPKHEGVEGLAELLADLSLVLVLYGIAVLCCIIFRNKRFSRLCWKLKTTRSCSRQWKVGTVSNQ